MDQRDPSRQTLKGGCSVVNPTESLFFLIRALVMVGGLAALADGVITLLFSHKLPEVKKRRGICFIVFGVMLLLIGWFVFGSLAERISADLLSTNLNN